MQAAITDLRVVGFLDVSNANILETKKTNIDSKVNEVVIKTLTCETSKKKFDFFIVEEGAKLIHYEPTGKTYAVVVLKAITPENFQDESLMATNKVVVIVSEGNHRFILADHLWVQNWDENAVSLFSCKNQGRERVFSTRHTDKYPMGLKVCAENGVDITMSFVRARARLTAKA